jgi:uncharacterized membrane-anchored protein
MILRIELLIHGIFSGENYVTLNYEISTLDLEKFRQRILILNTTTAYIWHLNLKMDTEWSKDLQNPPDDELYIKGKVKEIIYDWDEDEDSLIAEEPRIKELRVEYGIESYFVPEGKGLEIDSQQWTGRERVDVKVVVDKYGNAVIKSLLIDGEEVKI